MENTTKMLGGWGYVALVAGGFLSLILGPFVGIISLAGMVCVLIAFFRAGNELNLPSVKRDIILAIVMNIIAYILIMFVVVSAIVALVLHANKGGTVSSMAAAAFGAGTVISGIIAWGLSIVGSWYWYKASQALTDGTGVDAYKTGGLLIFIGAIAYIILIGGLIMWVGEIVQAVAFFSTPEKIEEDNATAT